MLWTDDLARMFAAPLASTEQDGQIYGLVPGETRWLQDALNRLTGTNLTVDGKAGPATRAAVRAFQSANGLQSDGIAGEQTRAMLKRLLTGAATAQPAPVVTCTGLPLRQVLNKFAFGRHQTLPHHQPQIDAIAACLLASLASPTPIAGLSLLGHADPVGSDVANTALGQRRAEAVVDAIEASLRRQAGSGHFSFVFNPSSSGELQPLPGDPG